MTIDKYQFLLKTQLNLGNNKCYTNPKVHSKLLGSRHMHEIFSLQKVRFNLLNLYPVIKSMAANKTQFIFASINPEMGGILKEAATLCNMLVTVDRWYGGFLTSALLKETVYDDETINPTFTEIIETTDVSSVESLTYVPHMFNLAEALKNKPIYPTVIFIPDVNNNKIILKEAHNLGFPIIAIVNSNYQPYKEITYPIYGNDSSLKFVKFTTFLLAFLITKANKRNKIFDLNKSSISMDKSHKQYLHKLYGSAQKKKIKAKLVSKSSKVKVDTKQTKNQTKHVTFKKKKNTV
jgi:small subunit ribosomal protein S2